MLCVVKTSHEKARNQSPGTPEHQAFPKQPCFPNFKWAIINSEHDNNNRSVLCGDIIYSLESCISALYSEFRIICTTKNRNERNYIKKFETICTTTCGFLGAHWSTREISHDMREWSGTMALPSLTIARWLICHSRQAKQAKPPSRWIQKLSTSMLQNFYRTSGINHIFFIIIIIRCTIAGSSQCPILSASLLTPQYAPSFNVCTSSSYGVWLLDRLNVQSFQPHYWLHMPLQRMQLP